MRIGCFSDFVFDSGVDIDPALLALMDANDFNCLNLEAPFLPAVANPLPKGINLYQRADGLDFLRRHRFAVVNLANNHIFDFGWPGLEETLVRLEAGGIRRFGAGRDLEDAVQPAVIEAGGKSVAFWGFAWNFTDAVNARATRPGTAPVIERVVRAALERGREHDLRIVYFHFGVEFEDLPDCFQKSLVDELLTLGLADVVIGTHPHCVQGIVEAPGRHGRSFAYFSLGNFLIPTGTYLDKTLGFPKKSEYGFAVTVDFGRELACTLVPYRISEDHRRVRLLTAEEDGAFRQHVAAISEPLHRTGFSYMRYLVRHRRRHHIPVFGAHERVNAILMVAFRAAETLAMRSTDVLGLRGVVRRLLRRSVE